MHNRIVRCGEDFLLSNVVILALRDKLSLTPMCWSHGDLTKKRYQTTLLAPFDQSSMCVTCTRYPISYDGMT